MAFPSSKFLIATFLLCLVACEGLAEEDVDVATCEATDGCDEASLFQKATALREAEGKPETRAEKKERKKKEPRLERTERIEKKSEGLVSNGKGAETGEGIIVIKRENDANPELLKGAKAAVRTLKTRARETYTQSYNHTRHSQDLTTAINAQQAKTGETKNFSHKIVQKAVEESKMAIHNTGKMLIKQSIGAGSGTKELVKDDRVQTGLHRTKDAFQTHVTHETMDGLGNWLDKMNERATWMQDPDLAPPDYFTAEEKEALKRRQMALPDQDPLAAKLIAEARERKKQIAIQEVEEKREEASAELDDLSAVLEDGATNTAASEPLGTVEMDSAPEAAVAVAAAPEAAPVDTAKLEAGADSDFDAAMGF